MPLCVSTLDVNAERLDQLLASGYRRTGWFFYRPQCPRCSACEPVRVAVADFQPSRSQQRAKKLGDQHLQVRWTSPKVDEFRVQLFNKHRRLRGLSHGDFPATADDYQSFLLNAACNVLELQLWYQEQLVAISITDIGLTSISAVYCFFDPDYSWLGLGTYAILQQIEQARQPAESRPFGNRHWLYLGLYVGENAHLNYKAKYLPHERLVGDNWQLYQRARN